MALGFGPNPRNIGGRDQIIEEQYNHLQHLSWAKPSIYTRAPKKVRPCSAKKFKDTMAEVRETQRRVAAVHGCAIDNRQPKTYHLTKKLSQAKKARNATRQTDHLNNLKSLTRRLGSIGSSMDRKKNPYDPIEHPAHMRRSSADFADMSIKTFISRIEELDNAPIDVYERTISSMSAYGSPRKKR